jgi:hypothetical protein
MTTTFIPEQPFAEALQQIRSDLDVWAAISEGQASVKWMNWAGVNLDTMMGSPQGTLAFVHDQETNLRLTSVSLMGEHWHARAMFAPACLELAFKDSDPSVRGAAFHALSRHYSFVKDPTGYLYQLIRFCSEKVPPRLLDEAQQNADRLLAVLEDMLKKECEELAGSCMEEMLLGPEKAFPYFSHRHPGVRRAAIRIWGFYWERTDQYAAICEKLALEDPDEDVRIWALDAVVATYAKTDDVRVGNLLAKIVYDQSKSLEYCKRAYDGLFHVRGMPRETHPSLIWPKFDFPFPEIVDWTFVDSFLRGGQRGRI